MPAYRGEHDDILQPFVDAMKYKLGANKHKGKRFEDLTFERMFELLQGEVVELREALESKNQFEIIFEAADIANFALFIATKAIREAATKAPDVSTRD